MTINFIVFWQNLNLEPNISAYIEDYNPTPLNILLNFISNFEKFQSFLMNYIQNQCIMFNDHQFYCFLAKFELITQYFRLYRRLNPNPPQHSPKLE